LVSAAKLPSKLSFHFIAKARYLPLLDKELQPRPLAILAVPVVAKHRSYCRAQLDNFVSLD